MKSEKNVGIVDCKPGCVHEGQAGGLRVCNYIFDVGHQRPCPAGPDCTEYTTQGERYQKHWDKVKAREVYDAGGTIPEIAKAVGVSKPTVSKWMQKNGLVPNGLKEKKAAATSQRVSNEKTCEVPASVPLTEWPLSMEISNDSATITVRGNTARDAQQLLTMALRAVEAIT